MKKELFWILIFVFLFLLSQDSMFWSDEVSLGMFGFPMWIYWIVFLQILIVIAIYVFSKKYWK